MSHQELSQLLYLNGHVLLYDTLVTFPNVKISEKQVKKLYQAIIPKKLYQAVSRKHGYSQFVSETLQIYTMFSGHLFLNSPTLGENARLGQDVKFILNVTALNLSY